MRHLAVAQDSAVVFAMKWHGGPARNLHLLGILNRYHGRTRHIENASVRQLQGSLGSVAISGDGRMIAVPSPRSGHLQILKETMLISTQLEPDICGVATSAEGFRASTGTGVIITAQRNINHAPDQMGQSLHRPLIRIENRRCAPSGGRGKGAACCTTRNAA